MHDRLDIEHRLTKVEEDAKWNRKLLVLALTINTSLTAAVIGGVAWLVYTR